MKKNTLTIFLPNVIKQFFNVENFHVDKESNSFSFTIGSGTSTTNVGESIPRLNSVIRCSAPYYFVEFPTD